MNETLHSPPFGQADLTNCERELIHLTGSIQPHGVLMVLSDQLEILQASANTATMLGLRQDKHDRQDELHGQPLAHVDPDLGSAIARLLPELDTTDPKPLRCRVGTGASRRLFEGAAHRAPGGGIVVELEPVNYEDRSAGERLQRQIAGAVERIGSALSIEALAETVVQAFREIEAYDRVMVYRFDPDGHGTIIAEARDPKLDSLLGHHYPASDIPQRARELYVRNRVRLLVDVEYEPVPVVPRLRPDTQTELDMSMCFLRSMSPLHLQYLKNMGVTATLVVSLVREGSLWGLVACHHYAPRHVPYPVRAAADLLAEVIATRIVAIENYVAGQVELLVRRLELRLIEAASTDGDWRLALFRNPRSLLQPIDATGVALFFNGEINTAGDVPSTLELRALLAWVAAQMHDGEFHTSSVERANQSLTSLTPIASGVLAVELSKSRRDYLMWFRKEQLSEVIWAGDPAKPVLDNDPLKLSPRRSFAAWSEIVRGTATRWSKGEIDLARAIGASLNDFIMQVQAVRLLITQHQLNQVRAEVVNSKEPVLITDASARVVFANESFLTLFPAPPHIDRLEDLAALATDSGPVGQMLAMLHSERASWRGELQFTTRDQGEAVPLPIGVRADVVPGPAGSALGFILIFTDLTERKRAERARRHLEDSLSEVAQGSMAVDGLAPALRQQADPVLGAILANANVAAMEITSAGGESTVAPLLEELESSTARAAALYRRLRTYIGS